MQLQNALIHTLLHFNCGALQFLVINLHRARAFMLAEHLVHAVEVSLFEAHKSTALLHNVMYISIEHCYYCYFLRN